MYIRILWAFLFGFRVKLSRSFGCPFMPLVSLAGPSYTGFTETVSGGECWAVWLMSASTVAYAITGFLESTAEKAHLRTMRVITRNKPYDIFE